MLLKQQPTVEMTKEIPQAKVEAYQMGAVRFYETQGRKRLPWRLTKDPWKILLAEMLLRKTAAVQVEKIFSELSRMRPEELAGMNAKTLEELLMPLGIFRERRRLLQEVADRTAKAGKNSLKNEEFLQSLPGVGRYSVNTVLCFAFGKAKPALDRNMIRIIERVFSIQSKRPRPHTDSTLWDAAESLVLVDKPREYNWGILDLAASVCRPKKPLCEKCPMVDFCDYAETIRSFGNEW